MSLIKAIILGIIQGLAEFLPISSSGHLVLAGHFLNVQKPDISFDIFLHVGSLIAVLIYFRKDISELFLSLFDWKSEKGKQNHKTILFLIIATFVTGMIGILFEDIIESLFSKPIIISGFLSITAIILLASDKMNYPEKLKMSEIGWLKSILIGFGQALAIIPGISRSGSTVAAGIFLKMERSNAARFSFLLSIPAILGAAILKLDEFKALDKSYYLPYSLGAIAAFVSGYAVIAMLLKLIQNRKLKYFAYYCFAVSIISFVWLMVV